MGRTLLFLAAATICWYLIRGVIARNRYVEERRSRPSQEIPADENRPSDVGVPEPEQVRDARFRDL